MASLAPAPPRLLLVEDDQETLEVLESLLTESGYAVQTATSPALALAALDEQAFHLVVSDLFAPSGQDAFGSVRPLVSKAAPTPVAVLTAWPVAAGKPPQDGLAWLMQKPFDFDELLAAIAQCLTPPFSAEQAEQVRLIERYLAAIGSGDRETLAQVCRPEMIYHLVSRSVFTEARFIDGLDAYFAYLQQVRARLPDYRIDASISFLHQQQIVTRFACSWLGRDGERLRLAGSMVCRFAAGRIAQVGVALNAQRLERLLALTAGG